MFCHRFSVCHLNGKQYYKAIVDIVENDLPLAWVISHNVAKFGFQYLQIYFKIDGVKHKASISSILLRVKWINFHISAILVICWTTIGTKWNMKAKVTTIYT